MNILALLLAAVAISLAAAVALATLAPLSRVAAAYRRERMLRSRAVRLRPTSRP